jgi:hypothetical protein
MDAVFDQQVADLYDAYAPQNRQKSKKHPVCVEIELI